MKSEKLKCRLLQFLIGALRVNDQNLIFKIFFSLIKPVAGVARKQRSLSTCVKHMRNSVMNIEQAVGSASSRSTGPGFDTRFGHLLLFPHPPIEEGQLSVTGESMCT